MDNKENFFIGWQDKMPERNRKALRIVLIPLFLLLPLLVLFVVQYQKPFSPHQFEFGQIKTYTGRYFAKPAPMLIAAPNSLPEGISSNILLVGYGKFGARGIMQELETKNGPLNGKEITLSGSLIHGDGKTLLELTDEEKALIAVDESPLAGSPVETLGEEQTLRGEILDPKCYFGVMKPGEGKIHKSCAIRCISGGIPPVFRAAKTDPGQAYRYYILVGANGEAINKNVLPFVAENVSITGKTGILNGWDVLYADPKDINLHKN